MVDDPCLNFAISAHGHAPRLNHLGIQLESDTDLKAMRRKLEEADHALVAQESADCCYATSDKYWVTDPGGVAWETFHTLATIPTFGEDVVPARDPRAAACCAPAATVPSGCCAKTADR